ncbi:NADH-quinone oxidoreductase subunit NuoF [Leptotrichia sp. oral taxon 212]|jgi:NADH dehydrogenase (quinone)|uniref:NADH-quinone oxidoreductase subunit NuoF n=1 Tax=Leptotrichia sp. oral taxon 212 TaxID=712357 RepID=UPI0006A98385|nr:NADH-quinone oxidoreductase subunit NuoF [Leptotrichia sp. oral taxon 212]ALA94763.1 NADH dehydrogenase [Leptotrichia sp. oral taxon 212]
MLRITSENDLNKIITDVENNRTYRKEVIVCGGTGCMSSGNDKILENLQNKVKELGLESEIRIVKTGCVGFCEKGPIVKIMPDNTFYAEVTPDDVDEIVAKDLITNETVKKLLYKDPITKETIQNSDQINFYKKQRKIALRNCGSINPEDIDDYIYHQGYKALEKAVRMTSQEVVDIIKDSGLRGRGGGGFSTGMKWQFALNNKADQKYVVCNADEGDPGAFMDRAILEGDPHSIVEAMAICGYAIGANKGLVYIRAEYPLAVKILQMAIKAAKERGLLGENIFNSGFNFDIEIKYGAGAFVCGEETALIHSMEGKRGEPTTKPPFPAESGYWGKPTNVNNVETFANIPFIINDEEGVFKNMGTKSSPGTKVFALAGKINNIGLIEIPMGTTLREVIYEIGGGIKDGKAFKAVQTGGPSGGCLTAKDLDTPIDFDTLKEKGSMMGSGGMIVMDEDDCMVSVSKFYLDFTVDESCGKCTPCRIGNLRLLELLEKITSGNGTEEDLDKLLELSHVIKDTSLCGLGQTAPNPVLSTMHNFWDEYVAHVRDKKCPSGKCTDLVRYMINEKCIGCTACSRVCPVSCISGQVKVRHEINQNACIKCGACYSTCRFSAIDRA